MSNNRNFKYLWSTISKTSMKHNGFQDVYNYVIEDSADKFPMELVNRTRNCLKGKNMSE
eukprot:Pgem_evm1s16825